MATPNYDVNYDDKRFTDVKAAEKSALNEVDVTYGNMISQSDKYYDKQIQATQDWADKQSQLQQEKTDFAIEEINQQKAQAKKDYTKEQSGAYVDWQKQSNQYGAEAEKTAAAGLAGSGYSESAQVSMYNTYQNRVATAREAYSLAVQDYNNAITEARLQNNSILAEIAAEALQKRLELSLQGFQYKNQLLLDKADKKLELKKYYSDEWQRVLTQINTENALAEEVRQHNADSAYRQAQLQEQKRQHDQTLAFQREQLLEQQRQFNVQQAQKSSGSSGGSIKKGGGSSGGGSSKKSTKNSKQKEITYNGKTYKSTGKESARANAQKNSATIDMDSVIALGYGPISAAKLNELVSKGVIKQYIEGNKIKFKKVLATTGNPFSTRLG